MSFLDHLNVLEIAASAEEAMTRHGLSKGVDASKQPVERRKTDAFGIDAVRFFDLDDSAS